MKQAPLSLPPALALLMGCQLLLDADDGVECSGDHECPYDEFCDEAAARCKLGRRPDLGARDAWPYPDADDRWLAPDRGPLDDMGKDAGTDADADAVDASVLVTDGPLPDGPLPDDAGTAPDFALSPEVYRGGECFEDPSGQLYEAGGDATFVPTAWCTPQLRAWLTRSNQSYVLGYTLGANEPTHVGFNIGSDSLPTLVDGSHFLFRKSNPGGVVTIHRVNLAAEKVRAEEVDQSPGGEQWHPTGDRGVYALVERTFDIYLRPISQVVIIPGRGLRRECKRDGREQWGAALQGDRVAWFERSLGQSRASLVLSSPNGCIQSSDRVEIALDGTVDQDSRLSLAEPWLGWLSIDGDGVTTAWVLNLGALSSGPRRLVPVDRSAGSAVELTIHGGRAGVVRYKTGGHQLELHDLVLDMAVRVDDDAQAARHPTLGPAFLVYARRQVAMDWVVHFTNLAGVGP